MHRTLNDFISADGAPEGSGLLDRFLEYIESRKLQLYDTQEAAILELFDEKNVILNTPTGSGKSMVAAALHFKSLGEGRRSVYTCPIKALVNEKWMALCREFGPENVGLSTGDATVNHDAPILCCTAEILANIALHDGENADIADVIMDEFHYYADRERGVAWQIPLLTMPQTRFLLMSATLGDTAFFEDCLTMLTKRPTATIASVDRPVPLDHSYSEKSLALALEELVSGGKGPVYVVHFTQLDAAQSAQDFTSINVCSKEEKAAIAGAIADFRFSSPYGPQIKRWLRHGIGIHHAGLLPKYRILIEQLAQQGLLKVICGTDTLGVGINVPIRTVLFTRLCKFDGEKTGILSARDFHQIGGRAGRKGFDDVGWVVAQAPEHFIENIKLAAKAATKGKKIVKRKPPERNFVNWDENTFKRLINARPEQLRSQFQVTHGMLLNVLSRPTDGCAAMRQLIRDSHETDAAKRRHTRRAWQLFRSLLEREIVEFIPPMPEGAKVRVNVELQEDFSMDQALSLYLIETIPHLDPESPDYALDLMTLVESIMEEPRAVLRKQVDKLKGQKIAGLKQEGMGYDERMEELEKIEHPKPNREFIYTTFNEFSRKHPWVGGENIRPKSIAREMFEDYRSFSDYVREYELQRSEGLLLRHLSRVHKILEQTVPDSAKNETVREMELYLGTMLRQVDSSLIDEWERMRDPDYVAKETEEALPPGAAEALADITRNTKQFTALVRNRVFTFVRALAIDDFDSALDTLATAEDADGEPWNTDRLKAAIDPFHESHARIQLTPEARNQRHTYVKVTDDKKTWNVQQILVDPDDQNDWAAEFEINLEVSRETKEPALKLLAVRSLV